MSERRMETEGKKVKRFLARYEFQGIWRAVDIYAYDREDAQARCEAMGKVTLDGEHVMSIPAIPVAGGLFTRLICWTRNQFAVRSKDTLDF